MVTSNDDERRPEMRDEVYPRQQSVGVARWDGGVNIDGVGYAEMEEVVGDHPLHSSEEARVRAGVKGTNGPLIWTSEWRVEGM